MQSAPRAVNRFAFVMHPLSVQHIQQHPKFRWTKGLPERWVESAAAHCPPLYLGTMSGGRSATTGQRVEGLLFALGATPQQMMERRPEFTYEKIVKAAHQAAKMGARVLGLGAFTKIVGDAGLTVSQESPIPVTSGRCLTVVVTLEAARQALRKMGHSDLSQATAMVVGATGTVGSVCSRLLAQTLGGVVLVSREPDRLKALGITLRAESPEARVTSAQTADEHIGQCDLVVLAAPATSGRLIPLVLAKPGAVVCDLAFPGAITEAEAKLRPDVLVIESGEVAIPGPVALAVDMGLPRGTVHACLAEPALLAMEGPGGRSMPGPDFWIERVKDMQRLFVKHGLAVAPLRSFGQRLSAADLAEKWNLAMRRRERSTESAWEGARAASHLERASAA